MADKRPPIDWDAIERDYRAGILSIREIAAAHGITHGAINKRAKRDKWERDLKARIQARAETLVSKREVSTLVSSEAKATEHIIIEANAEAIVRVRMEHRRDIGRARSVKNKLLEQLAEAIDNREEIEALIEAETADDRSPMRRAMMLKAVNLGTHAGILKDLAAATKTLVDLERQAFGINGTVEEEKPAETALSRIELARRVAFMLAAGAHAMKQQRGGS